MLPRRQSDNVGIVRVLNSNDFSSRCSSVHKTTFLVILVVAEAQQEAGQVVSQETHLKTVVLLVVAVSNRLWTSSCVTGTTHKERKAYLQRFLSLNSNKLWKGSALKIPSKSSKSL